MSPRAVILFAAGIAIAALFMPEKPRLSWNASASAPVGLYLASCARNLTRGDLVLAEPPEQVRPFAATRGYLPLHVLLVKRIAALSGDRVCALENRVIIDGRVVALRREWDGRHRVLPRWQGCRTLGGNDVFLLMADVPASFDGRYFGAVSRGAVLGKLKPLWTY